jgi:hypothetical protein
MEFLSVGPVAIAKQIAGPTVPRESFEQLPGRPFRRGKTNKPERDRGNHEEIGRDQALHVVLQKCAPILRRWSPVSDQVLGNRGLRQLEFQFQQLSVNPWSAPARIRQAHPMNQIDDFPQHGGSSFRTATLPLPIQSESLAMPSDDGLGLDDNQYRSPAAPESCELFSSNSAPLH